MKYDPINKIMVEDSIEVKDSKIKDAIERGEALFRENSYKTIKKIEEHLKNRHYDSAIKLIPELRSHLEFALNSMKNETN